MRKDLRIIFIYVQYYDDDGNSEMEEEWKRLKKHLQTETNCKVQSSLVRFFVTKILYFFLNLVKMVIELMKCIERIVIYVCMCVKGCNLE
jgi:hypothetical protein